uniref:Membrane progestin receptor gamma n=1 Tax=Petromyzon marinus TaxID=7757 RepID=A0A1I9VZE3_PETMA|nr:membrane progestin receptor gamma [Petromyzon marinus]
MNMMGVPPLLGVHQVPQDFHEDSILAGYRNPRSSARECIYSIFQFTNETINIWTHFLPTWYFVWWLLVLWGEVDLLGRPYHRPLAVFMLSCCVYPIASTCAHTFSTMSQRARHICFFFDYAALSLYSLGSAMVYNAYVIPDKWLGGTFHRCFVPIALFNTVLCTSMACYSRLGLPFIHYNRFTLESCLELKRPRMAKVLRVVAFAFPYLFDNIPLFYRIFLCSGEGCTDNEAVPTHRLHTLFAFLTGFLFATHLPERLAPGVFDYVGHSHQLFHVSAIVGTHFQIKAVLLDLHSRADWLSTASVAAPSLLETGGAFCLAIALNLLVIAFFAVGLYSKQQQQRQQPNPVQDNGAINLPKSHAE